MSAIAPSASAIRNRILDAGRDHTPLEPEDAEALVALLDKLITLEQASPLPPAIHAREVTISRPPRPDTLSFSFDMDTPAAACKVLRRLAKALKPRKPSRKG